MPFEATHLGLGLSALRTTTACLSGLGDYPDKEPFCEVLGMKASADYMKKRSDTVALLVVDEEDRLLILWHEKYNFWTVPLGKVEEGEIDVRAAQREAFEELGIFSECIELIETIHKPASIDEFSDIIISLCQVKSHVGQIANCEPDKHSELHFVHIDQIEHLKPLSYPTRIIAGILGSECHIEIVSRDVVVPELNT